MDPLLLKFIAIGFIFVSGVIGGLLPLRIGMTDRGKRTMALGNAFAGGIFLGAGLIHLLPDALGDFAQVLPNVDYPLGALLAGIGFLGVLLTEKVLVRHISDDEVPSGVGVGPVLLFLVLSIHSVIAGATFGLETAAATSLALFIAIIAHKGTAAFALGISLKTAGATNRRLRNNVIVFSAMTPIGVLLGILFILLNIPNPELFEAIFDGLAAGTFMYIAIMDILQETFEESTDRWQRFGMVLIGFVFMGGLAIFT